LSLLIAILTLALVAVVVLVISAPLRSSRRGAGSGGAQSPGEEGEEGQALARDKPLSSGRSAGGSIAARGELEAAREAKYREIRDAELDYRTGKLSREDYEAIDGELRGEAIEILNRLDAEAEA
jgi:hypothetical protein